MLPASQPQHGPARLVASGVSPKKVLAAAGINALIACLCGLAVVTLTGYWWFILVGIACLVAGWCYVGGKHPYGYHYLGEIFVFIFFGLVAACGTMFALAGTISTEACSAAPRRPHRRRGPVRQQPTRRRNRPHARQAHMDDRFGAGATARFLRLRCCPSPCCCSPLIYCCCRRCDADNRNTGGHVRDVRCRRRRDRKKKIGEALPLCTFSSLALAATYVCCVVFA